jgi:multiple sugar transport system substrate-binding protein
MTRKHRIIVPLLTAALIGSAALAGCSNSSTTSEPTDLGNQLTVWDYYGDATPIKPAVAAFEKANPNVHVTYQSLTWDAMEQKYAIAASSGTAPDVATLDMTWIPTFASKGLFSDLSGLAKGTVNGEQIASMYQPGGLQAMNYDGHLVTMLYDFDAYALYYRADLFKAKNIQPPKTWTDLEAAEQQLATDTNGDGKPDHNLLQVVPQASSYVQLLYQLGGSVLDATNKKAAFNSAAGVQALEEYKKWSDLGLYWGNDQGDSSGIAGIKDDRIAMFINGPWMMGIIKSGASEQAGKWAVTAAPTPADGKPASYLGGTGLSIATNAPHKAMAWKFIQFLLTSTQQLGVATYAGAAPATNAALDSALLTEPDPYFGGQAPLGVFKTAMTTAVHYPYVAQWNDIDQAITDAVTAALLGKKSAQQALDDAAKEVDSYLAP